MLDHANLTDRQDAVGARARVAPGDLSPVGSARTGRSARGTIGERLDIPNATLSFHLKELLHAGLVTSRQTGRFVYYAPIIDAMNGLVGFLTENCCSASGESCIVVKASRSPKKAAVKKVSVSPRRRRASLE